jgi:hypothetical protein
MSLLSKKDCRVKVNVLKHFVFFNQMLNVIMLSVVMLNTVVPKMPLQSA